jgi:hypothetical protein
MSKNLYAETINYDNEIHTLTSEITCITVNST